MKKQLLGLAKSLVLSSVLLLPFSRASAAIVYDNTTTDLTQFYATNAEFGDPINLGGTDRLLTDFEFYGYTPVAAAGLTYVLRFYANVGTNPPTTAFFTGDPTPVVTGSQHYTVSGLSLAVPDSFTWTVQFSGPGAKNTGLLLYNPPTVGTSLNDFWQNNGGAWSLAQINGGATFANFAARVTAVPEPGTIAVGAVGLLLLGYRLRRRSP